MSDVSELGILYTEHSGLAATTPGLASLWSYEICARGRDRRTIALNPDGSREYWLDRSDRLLNTILPGCAPQKFHPNRKRNALTFCNVSS